MRKIPDGLFRLNAPHRRLVTAFLADEVACNAYLLGQIARGALTSDAIAGPLLGYSVDGVLSGVACCGSNLVVSSPCALPAIDAFAEFARTGSYLVRVAIGEDEVMDRFMAAYGRDPAAIVLERSDQRLFAVTAATLRPPPKLNDLRPAELTERTAVMDADRAMITEELGFDPFARQQRLYREGWIRRLREARAWIVREPDGPVLFKVDQSAVSIQVIQLSGVYTAPGVRGQGVATDALAQMCRRLLEEVPVVALYVHADNQAAVSLYHRLGFVERGRVRSIWFET